MIGLPGETIEFKDDVLYVNGEVVEQTFLDSQFVEDSKAIYNVNQFTEDFKTTVGDDEYFVMGDNRLRSTDSRVLGGFKIDDMIGDNGIVIYPFKDMRWFKEG